MRADERSSNSDEVRSYREGVDELTGHGDALDNIRRRIRRIGRHAGMEACETGEFPVVRAKP